MLDFEQNSSRLINSNSNLIKIEPSILIWARETIGLSLDEVAIKIGKSTDKIKKWEAGLEYPTYSQLEKLAYSIYKRPLAAFFLPFPPKESTPKQDFRSIPDSEFEKLTPEIRLIIRKNKYHQLVLKNINENINPVINPVFKTIKITISNKIPETCSKISEILVLTDDVRSNIKNSDDAFSFYREAVEKNGIFVFQYPMKGIRGFSLMDIEFPVIVVNSKDTANSKNFTIFHEFCHILFNTGGILTEILRIDSNELQNKIEIFCNKFASEILLPTSKLLSDEIVKINKHNTEWSDDVLNQLAKKYVVSQEVVLRKLLDNRLTTNKYYEFKRKQWSDFFNKSKEILKNKKGGPSYHVTNLSHLGKNFVRQVLNNFYKGKINTTDVSNFLGIKISKIKAYEQRVYK